MRIVFILFFFICTTLSAQPSNKELTIGFSESPPFVYQNARGELDGISIWLWKHITAELDIAYKMKSMPLDQIITGLEDGSVDMSVNPLTITANRSQMMDFSMPFYVSHSSIVIEQSSAWQKGLQFLSSFFSMNFLKSVIALFLIIFIFGLLVWMFEKRKNFDHFEDGIRGVWSGIWWSAVTMTTVGYGDKAPQTLGGRIIGLVWMFTAIIIISGFTASIASSLTVNQLSWSSNRIEDFKSKQIATVENSATSAWLDKHFYKKKKNYTDLSDCLNALKKQRTAAVAYDDPILKYIIKNDSTFNTLEVLPIKFNPQYYAMGFALDFDNNLRQKISKKIIEISERTDWQLLLAEYNLN